MWEQIRLYGKVGYDIGESVVLWVNRRIWAQAYSERRGD